MNPMEALHATLMQAVPGAESELDRPAKAEGHWFLNITLHGHEVIVEWKPAAGFGVTASPDAGYGEGPEEVFADADATRDRVIELLRTKGRTRPPVG